MENSWNVNASVLQDYYELEASNQMDPDQGNDLLARRLKNRERQRRYRARKRLEADRQRSSSSGTTETLMDMEPQTVHTIFVDRTLCRRNWKKDARSAHIHTKAEDLSTENATSYLMGEFSVNNVSVSDDPSSLASCEFDKMKAGGRNWKAEARGKKT